MDNGANEAQANEAYIGPTKVGLAKQRVYGLCQACTRSNLSKYTKAEQDEKRNEERCKEQMKHNKRKKKLTNHQEVP
eukprot:11539788-Ditylum_brightwellii.AAC.1